MPQSTGLTQSDHQAGALRIRVRSSLTYRFAQPTPVIAILNVHYSRFGDLETPDHIVTDPQVAITSYRDGFGNWCSRFVAPTGRLTISTGGVVRDTGLADPVDWNAWQHRVEDLPPETLIFLLGSRYCETDRLSNEAWRLFGDGPDGYARVQAICDFVHRHVVFGYEHADPSRSAMETFRGGVGVCRDYAHLAIAFCRCLNIPARYCTGYLSDIGDPLPYPPGDHAAWMEAYLGGRWRIFDPRNNRPKVGRILIARGRDASDVPLTYTFGPAELESFDVITALDNKHNHTETL